MNDFIFNFSASYSGGGIKRAVEYVKAFNDMGGAVFILHDKCRGHATDYGNNSYHFISPGSLSRLFNDCGYLRNVLRIHGSPKFYYSYGIPIYKRIANVNWFHLSNVLPLVPSNIPMRTMERLKMNLLGMRIRNNLCNADVISAESRFSLGLINERHASKLYLSVNGSDDELGLSKVTSSVEEDWAVVVGTYKYKCLRDSLQVFKMLRELHCPGLRLKIIGDRKSIPDDVVNSPGVDVLGLLSRREVISILTKSRYYISTTMLENSYNAASEGACLARESFISDIGPHRELFADTSFERIWVSGVVNPMIHVERKNVSLLGLKSWKTVISEMISRLESSISVGASISDQTN